MKYTTSFRNSVLKKILPPSNRSVTSVSKETGVAVVTINNWPLVTGKNHIVTAFLVVTPVNKVKKQPCVFSIKYAVSDFINY